MHLPADPRWTPVIGGALVAAAMVGCTLCYTAGVRGAGMVLALVVAVLIASVGVAWTFRDWSTPRRR